MAYIIVLTYEMADFAGLGAQWAAPPGMLASLLTYRNPTGIHFDIASAVKLRYRNLGLVFDAGNWPYC